MVQRERDLVYSHFPSSVARLYKHNQKNNEVTEGWNIQTKMQKKFQTEDC